MKILTVDAVIVCDHEQGLVTNKASQSWVTVEQRPLLVATDPETRSLVGCPNLNPSSGQEPCLETSKVQNGYSKLGRIDGQAICLDTVTGLTDGSPPGTFHYSVRTPGQELVSVYE